MRGSTGGPSPPQAGTALPRGPGPAAPQPGPGPAAPQPRTPPRYPGAHVKVLGAGKGLVQVREGQP
jgi:hypothetical protein